MFVTDLYRTLLGRDPEPNGLDTWASDIIISFRTVLSTFWNSDEFARRRSSLLNASTASDTAKRLYQDILGRTPSAAETSARVDYLRATQDIEGVLKGFFESREYLETPRTLADHVTTLYRGILGRSPEPGVVPAWTALFRSLREDLLKDMAGSDEFKTRARDLVAQPGPTGTGSGSASTATIVITPTAFGPQFTVGDKAATLGFFIQNRSSGPLTGTIAANVSWLTAAGHSSYNWIAPETVNVTADPTGLDPGIYRGALTVAASSASNTPVSIPVTMTISAALQITTSSLPDALSGQSYNVQLQASGGTGYVWSLQSGDLPGGLTLSQSGLISGTPGAISGSTTRTVNIGLQDARGRFVYKTFTMTWKQGLGISQTGASNFQFVVGTLYAASNSISFQAAGGTSPYTWAATGLPAGLSINTASGLVTGTPTQPGTFRVAITITDASNQSTSGTFDLVVVTTSLIISNENGSTPATLPPGTVGTSYSRFLLAVGGSQALYTWATQGTLPLGLTAQNGPGCPASCALKISGTPTQAGTFTFTVQVRDSLGDTAQQTFTLIINSGAPLQITTTTLPLGTVGQAYSFAFTASGGAGGYTWSFIGPGPDSGLQLSSLGMLQGTSSVANDCPTGPNVWIGNQPPFGTFSPLYFQVQVTDAAGNAANNEFCVPSYYPAPRVTSITPSIIPSDGQTYVLTITGSNFKSNASVAVGGGLFVSTTYVNSTTLTFSVTTIASNGWGPGTYTFWVVQPYANVSNKDKSFKIQ